MRRKELLVLMVGASTINYIGRTAMAVAGPDIQKQYQFSEAELGQIFSAFWLGYAVMMCPSGWLADRFGAGRVLGICGLITAILLAGNAAMTMLAGFLLLRLLFECVCSAVSSVRQSDGFSLPEREDGERAGPCCGRQQSRRGPGALPCALGEQVGRMARSISRRRCLNAHDVRDMASPKIWIRNTPVLEKKPEFLLRLRKPLLLLALQGFCIGYFYSFGDTWSFYYFREVRHFSEERSALSTTLLQVAGGIMMPLGGWLSDRIAPRYGRIRPALLALGMSGALMAASTAAKEPVMVFAFITVAYSLVVACEGVYSWALLTSSPDAPGAGFGFANTISSAAQFLAPLAFPWIAARWGWDAAMYSTAFACFVGAVMWWWAGSTHTYRRPLPALTK